MIKKMGERNGKGKEYNKYSDELVFEGEYLNGKRNGKGKEYYDGELKFEGEYLNDNIYNGKFHDYKSKKITELKNGKRERIL